MIAHGITFPEPRSQKEAEIQSRVRKVQEDIQKEKVKQILKKSKAIVSELPSKLRSEGMPHTPPGDRRRLERSRARDDKWHRTDSRNGSSSSIQYPSLRPPRKKMTPRERSPRRSSSRRRRSPRRSPRRSRRSRTPERSRRSPRSRRRSPRSPRDRRSSIGSRDRRSSYGSSRDRRSPRRSPRRRRSHSPSRRYSSPRRRSSKDYQRSPPKQSKAPSSTHSFPPPPRFPPPPSKPSTIPTQTMPASVERRLLGDPFLRTDAPPRSTPLHPLSRGPPPPPPFARINTASRPNFSQDYQRQRYMPTQEPRRVDMYKPDAHTLPNTPNLGLPARIVVPRRTKKSRFDQAGPENRSPPESVLQSTIIPTLTSQPRRNDGPKVFIPPLLPIAILPGWEAVPIYPQPEPAQPSYVQPKLMQPSYAPPKPIQPSYAPPKPIQPSYAPPKPIQPSYAPPKPIQPSFAQPKPIQPSYTPPQQVPANNYESQLHSKPLLSNTPHPNQAHPISPAPKPVELQYRNVAHPETHRPSYQSITPMDRPEPVIRQPPIHNQPFERSLHSEPRNIPHPDPHRNNAPFQTIKRPPHSEPLIHTKPIEHIPAYIPDRMEIDTPEKSNTGFRQPLGNNRGSMEIDLNPHFINHPQVIESFPFQKEAEPSANYEFSL